MSQARPAAHDEVGGESGSVLTADAIAAIVGGRLVGDADVRVSGIAPLDRAAAQHLSFLASPRYAELFASSAAGVVLVSPDLAESPGRAAARVVVDRPHEALLKLIPSFHRPAPREPGVAASARVGRGVRLGTDVRIEDGVVLRDRVVVGDRVTIGSGTVVGEGAAIGDDVLLHPGVTVYAGARIGRRVIVHSGARIGSDGFGYVFREGRHEKIPHVGGCVVEDDVEIGANTTIDRGSIDDTVIGAGTKIDNLVQVGHNVRIGRLCLIMAQAGIAGSVHIEDGCIVAGQAGISGHVVVGKGARLAAQAGVFGDIPAGETWSGYPARPHKDALRAQAAMFRLPKIIRALERLVSPGDDPKAGA